VKFYCLYNDVVAPKYATKGSACFDIYAYLNQYEIIKSYDSFNCETNLPIFDGPKDKGKYDKYFIIPSGFRVLVPTGLIFDICDGHSVRLHMRSGLAYKKGLSLANGEGVIDNDYIEQVYAVIVNNSIVSVTINHGDRICQGEEINDLPQIYLNKTLEKPVRKAEHGKGFGGTGTK